MVACPFSLLIMSMQKAYSLRCLSGNKLFVSELLDGFFAHQQEHPSKS